MCGVNSLEEMCSTIASPVINIPGPSGFRPKDQTRQGMLLEVEHCESKKTLNARLSAEESKAGRSVSFLLLNHWCFKDLVAKYSYQPKHFFGQLKFISSNLFEIPKLSSNIFSKLMVFGFLAPDVPQAWFKTGWHKLWLAGIAANEDQKNL